MEIFCKLHCHHHGDWKPVEAITRERETERSLHLHLGAGSEGRKPCLARVRCAGSPGRAPVATAPSQPSELRARAAAYRELGRHTPPGRRRQRAACCSPARRSCPPLPSLPQPRPLPRHPEPRGAARSPAPFGGGSGCPGAAGGSAKGRRHGRAG